MSDATQQDKQYEKKVKQKTDRPDRQYFFPAQVVETFIERSWADYHKPTLAQFLLSFMAGAMISFGALLSILITMGVSVSGLHSLLAGIGFAAGYVMVFLSGALLFTEVNILLPTFMLQEKTTIRRNMFTFWAATYAGNFVGALFVGLIIHLSGSLPVEFYAELSSVMSKKMSFMENGVWGWFQVLISGILANWLVGLAAFLATTAQDVTGKIISVTIPVVIYIAANFQHSQANMSYFSYGIFQKVDFSALDFILLNIVPASIGNLIGGGLLVSLIFTYAYKDEIDEDMLPKDE